MTLTLWGGILLALLPSLISGDLNRTRRHLYFCGGALANEGEDNTSMNNKHRKRNFTPSDDILIQEQPLTGIGLKTLETMLHVSRETLLRRADELGVTLVTRDVCDVLVDTRKRRRTEGLFDPLLERLKEVHGARK